MKLVFKDPARRQDQFVINARTDNGDPIVSEGETFEVDDATGRDLLANYFPRLQPLPGQSAESSKTLSAADIIARADEPTLSASERESVNRGLEQARDLDFADAPVIEPDSTESEQEAERPA